MRQLNVVLVCILSLLVSACSGSNPEKVEQKIKEKQELTASEKKVVFDYLNDVMVKVKNDPKGHKVLREEFPQLQPFVRYLNKSNDEQLREMTLEFIRNQKKEGKDKVYTYNPMYDLIINRSNSFPVADLECELVTEYIYSAFTSGYKGDELKDHYPILEQVLVNWSNSDDPIMKKAVNDGMDKAVIESM